MNPKSLENLQPRPRLPRYGEKKRKRDYNLTDTAHEGIREVATLLSLPMQEFIELIGRRSLSEDQVKIFQKWLLTYPDKRDILDS